MVAGDGGGGGVGLGPVFIPSAREIFFEVSFSLTLRSSNDNRLLKLLGFDAAAAAAAAAAGSDDDDNDNDVGVYNETVS
jgi:hypothetical protein